MSWTGTGNWLDWVNLFCQFPLYHEMEKPLWLFLELNTQCRWKAIDCD
jgi:hypothetical protein